MLAALVLFTGCATGQGPSPVSIFTEEDGFTGARYDGLTVSNDYSVEKQIESGTLESKLGLVLKLPVPLWE